MTDRFSRSDGSSTSACQTSERDYCGGTWRGIINKLDYISGMGFTAIWISPIGQQINGRTGEGEAYHGYWPTNLYALNERFGTEQDLRDLVAAVHSRGMYIMLDVVVNHFANQGDIIVYSDFVPLSDSRYFHPKCDIDWGNQTSIELCWMGNGYVHLVDVDTENDFVVSTLETYMAALITNYEFDGLRLDASRNIRKPFWTKLCLAANVYCQGEVWAGDPELVCPYQEYMDGLHNYPMKEVATTALTSSTGNMADLINMASKMNTRCKDVTLFGTFMENHDNPRIGSFTTDPARLQNVAALNILADGIPVLYYGQEQALTGSNDPANREALWLTDYRTTGNLVPTITSLNRLRNHAASTSPTFLTTSAVYTLLSSSVIRVRKENLVFVLTNTGSGASAAMTMDGFAPSLDLVEVLTCTHARADEKGRLPLVLRGEPMVLYPESLLSGSGICAL